MPRRALLPPSLILLASLSVLGAHASGQLPIPFPGEEPARCAWSANVLACMEDSGSLYSIATQGRDTYLRGFEASSGRHWAQTGTRYGNLTFFSGVASDGQIWVGTSRGIGWTNISRFSSSSGDSARLSCGRVSGCKQQPR
jgi:hypothetical protein